MTLLEQSILRAKIARRNPFISSDLREKIKAQEERIAELEKKNLLLLSNIKTVVAENERLQVMLNIDISSTALKYKFCTVHDIIFAVADDYGISVGDLVSPRRVANLIEPRHIAMYLAKKLTVKSLPQIGHAIGDRDHTTILHGVRKVEINRKADPLLDQTISRIERTIRAKYEQGAGG